MNPTTGIPRCCASETVGPASEDGAAPPISVTTSRRPTPTPDPARDDPTTGLPTHPSRTLAHYCEIKHLSQNACPGQAPAPRPEGSLDRARSRRTRET